MGWDGVLSHTMAPAIPLERCMHTCREVHTLSPHTLYRVGESVYTLLQRVYSPYQGGVRACYGLSPWHPLALSRASCPTRWVPAGEVALLCSASVYTARARGAGVDTLYTLLRTLLWLRCGGVEYLEGMVWSTIWYPYTPHAGALQRVHCLPAHLYTGREGESASSGGY